MLNLLKKINWQYAIGEIIIVIIGISIAFALNNWAAQRKSDKEKRQYLENLQENLKDERLQLEGNIAVFERNIKEAMIMYRHFNNPIPGRDTMIKVLVRLATVVNFNPVDVIYQTLINSGDLKLIDNFALKTEIEEHYSNHSIIRQEYERQHKIHEQYLGPYFINHLDFTKIYQGDHSYLDQPGLKNIINALHGSYTIAMNASIEGMKRCNALSDGLEKELNAY